MNASLPQVVCVRHGETAWTITGQLTGRTANATPLVDRTTLLNALDPGDRARNHTM